MIDYVAPYREIAAQFGLDLFAPSEGEGAKFVVVVLDGVYEGVPVHVYRATSGDARYSYVWVSARRALPGDLGLSITRTALATKLLAAVFGTSRVSLKTPDGFDDAFEVHAAEPPRVFQLLDAPARAALLAWDRAGRVDAAKHASAAFGIVADDERVYVELMPEAWKWKVFDRTAAADELALALRSVTAVARALDAATAHVAPSTVMANEVAAWRAFAEARGLAFSPSPLRITGRVGGTERAAGSELVLRAVTAGDGKHTTEVRRPLAQPLSFFVRIKPRERLDFYAWDPEGPHEHLGDRELDAAFNVVTGDLAAARALLTRPAVRAALLDAKSHGDRVLIDNRGVGVERDGLSTDAVDPAVARVDAIVRAFG